MLYRHYFIVVNFLLISFIASPTWAGSQQGGEPQFSVEEIAKLTKKVEKTLAAKGARVFIIGRNGRPTEDLPKGVKYTHVAFGVYSKIQTDDGRVVPGYAFYNLYQSTEEGSKSKLVTDYAIDFLSGVYESNVGIVIPTPAVQKRLLSFIGTPDYEALHNPNYSVMANPFNAKYQNCTEYVLDVLNAAIYKTTDKNELKQLAQAYFEPQAIHMSPFTTFFGSLFVAGVHDDDHTGQIKTATYTSIVNYLQTYHLSQEVMEINL